MECHIRRARRDDAEAISRIVIAALRESNARDYPAEVIAQVEQSFSPAAVCALLANRVVFVAACQGQLLATASLDGDVVRTVFVAPAHQGAGIGKQLMDAIHAQAVRAGIKSLRVPSSITAQAFYARLGYQKIRDAFHGAERTIVMEKSTLTLPEAAHALNVSCAHLAQLLDVGAMPVTSADGQPVITFSDLIAYKDKRDGISRAAMEALADQARDLDLGYE